MTVFWRYVDRRRQIARAVARPAVTNATPAPQKTTSSASAGDHEPVSEAHRVEEPGTDRDEVEDAHEVVGGRVVGALLVVVVEPVELRHDDPARERHREEEDPAGAHAPADQSFCKNEGKGEPGDVCGGKRPPDDPSAPLPTVDARLLQELDDGERLGLVEDERRRKGGSVSVQVRTPLR